MFKETWNKNNGNILASIAVSMSLLACALWYFNLLPEIEFEPPQVLGDQIPATQLQPIALQISVTAPENFPSQKVKGFIEVLAPGGTLAEPADRLSIHPFSADRGGMAAVLVEHLPKGSYGLLAYLDINGNEALDFQDGLPVEPVRTAVATASEPTDYEISSHLIQLEVGRPQFLFMKF
ncbi:MAG: hypothetical protein VXZ82_19455 [Planctomycetota bacterium]|nr:hypothetical protein [Planctomycetota bacterium]